MFYRHTLASQLQCHLHNNSKHRPGHLCQESSSWFQSLLNMEDWTSFHPPSDFASSWKLCLWPPTRFCSVKRKCREIDWTWPAWLYLLVTRGGAGHSWCPPGGGRGRRGGSGSRRASCPRSWWPGRAPPPPCHQRARPCQLELLTTVREDFTI